jgi:hypothetical protein
MGKLRRKKKRTRGHLNTGKELDTISEILIKSVGVYF